MRPDARRRKVERRGSADPADARDQNARSLQLLLTRAADLAQDEVAGVTLDFAVAEHAHSRTLSASVRPAVRALQGCGPAPVTMVSDRAGSAIGRPPAMRARTGGLSRVGWLSSPRSNQRYCAGEY